MLNWIENNALLCAIAGVLATHTPAVAFDAAAFTFCEITFSGEPNSTIFWADEPAVIPPKVESSCGQISSLLFEDTYFPIGCRSEGLEGYFAPARWRSVKTKGDGGVDVTGVPKSVPVEGAGTAQWKVDGFSGAQFSIVAPADGYFSFRLRSLGGSNHLEQPVAIAIDGQPALFHETEIFSSIVHQGEVFSLRIPDIDPELSQHIEFFQFITNATGVIERNWTACSGSSTAAYKQLITVTKPTLADVVLPAAALVQPDPETGAGMPFIDRDSDLETTEDQSILNGKDGIFSIEWTDYWIGENDEKMLIRKWVITDICADVAWEKDQVLQGQPNRQVLHQGPVRLSDVPHGGLDVIRRDFNGWPGGPGL